MWRRKRRSGGSMQDPAGNPPEPLPGDVVHFILALRAATPRVFVTPALVALNVAVFAAMGISGAGFINPPVEKLLEWGANYGPAVVSGEWWRPLTCMFVHAGILHIFFNMYVLWQSGRLVERLTGNVGFLVLYLFSGLVASFCSMLWHFETVAVGASGAVFGVYGGLVGLLLRHRMTMPARMRKLLLRDALIFIAANLALGAAIRFIDHAAHLGGLLAGLALGALLAHPLTAAGVAGRPRRSFEAALLGAALVAAGAGLATRRDTPFTRATAHLRAGEYAPAVAEMDRELAAHPDDVRAHLLRGSALLLSRKYDEAIDDLSEVIRFDPQNAFPYSLRATAWTETGELEQALADYDKAVELEPKRGEYLHARAFVHFRLGNDTAAEADWRRAADSQRDPEVKAGSLENIGLIYVRRREWRAALDHADAVDAVHAGMTWNSLFRWIAADQIGVADTARAAETIWRQHRADADVEALRGLLPQTLQRYLDDRPNSEAAPDSTSKPRASHKVRWSRSSRHVSAGSWPKALRHQTPASARHPISRARASRSPAGRPRRKERGAPAAPRRLGAGSAGRRPRIPSVPR
jgi:membrane associated rhomboid family serine protease